MTSCIAMRRNGGYTDVRGWRQMLGLPSSLEKYSRQILWPEYCCKISRLEKKVADMKFDVKFREFGGNAWNFPCNLTSIFRSCVSLQGHHTKVPKDTLKKMRKMKEAEIAEFVLIKRELNCIRERILGCSSNAILIGRKFLIWVWKIWNLDMT